MLEDWERKVLKLDRVGHSTALQWAEQTQEYMTNEYEDCVYIYTLTKQREPKTHSNFTVVIQSTGFMLWELLEKMALHAKVVITNDELRL